MLFGVFFTIFLKKNLLQSCSIDNLFLMCFSLFSLLCVLFNEQNNTSLNSPPLFLMAYYIEIFSQGPQICKSPSSHSTTKMLSWDSRYLSGNYIGALYWWKASSFSFTHSFRSILYLGKIDNFFPCQEYMDFFPSHPVTVSITLSFQCTYISNRLTLFLHASFLYLFESSFEPKDPRFLLSIKAHSINLCTFSWTCSAHLREIVADDPQHSNRFITIVGNCIFCFKLSAKQITHISSKILSAPNHQHLPGCY